MGEPTTSVELTMRQIRVLAILTRCALKIKPPLDARMDLASIAEQLDALIYPNSAPKAAGGVASRDVRSQGL
jgi:hypothetical protein